MNSVPETENASAANIFIPEEWSEVANSISDSSNPSVTVICGAKNAGKSTFSRHLVNVLLQRYRRIAYLDTDVGQAEFTPPGCLSLTLLDKVTPDLAGARLKTPKRCFFFGDISSKRDPKMYLMYIYALYDHYRKHYCLFEKSESSSNSGVPLVINTPGWVKGVGYDILVDMLKYIAPSHVVKICISAERKNLPTGAFWLEEGDDDAVAVLEISSARQDFLNRSVLVRKDARHLRDSQIIAYFRQCFPDVTTIKELAYALAAHPPYVVPISDFKIKHLHCEVPSSEIFYSLNATIVGLAIISEGSEDFPRCVGLGIVRGIDTSKQVLYLITPVPQKALENVTLLLQGFVQIPICLLEMIMLGGRFTEDAVLDHPSIHNDMGCHRFWSQTVSSSGALPGLLPKSTSTQDNGHYWSFVTQLHRNAQLRCEGLRSITRRDENHPSNGVAIDDGLDSLSTLPAKLMPFSSKTSSSSSSDHHFTGIF